MSVLSTRDTSSGTAVVPGESVSSTLSPTCGTRVLAPSSSFGPPSVTAHAVLSVKRTLFDETCRHDKVPNLRLFHSGGSRSAALTRSPLPYSHANRVNTAAPRLNIRPRQYRSTIGLASPNLRRLRAKPKRLVQKTQASKSVAHGPMDASAGADEFGCFAPGKGGPAELGDRQAETEGRCLFRTAATLKEETLQNTEELEPALADLSTLLRGSIFPAVLRVLR